MASDNQHLIPDGIPGNLRGAKGRVITGGGIICVGVLNFVLAIAMIIAASSSYYDFTGIGITQLVFGIGFLVLSIVAGCFGIYSRQSSCRIITYLVLCVVLAIFTGYGVFETASLIYIFYGYGSSGSINALLLANTITNALHCVLSIAGASFTCGAVCCVPEQRRIEQPMFGMPNPGAIQHPQPTLNAYNVDMRTTVPVIGNPPSYEYPVTVKTTA